MYRREFLKVLASGMVASWAFGRWPGALPVSGEAAANPDLLIACLADAHLRDGSNQGPEARSLARAVAEIKALNPAPNLVFFAGDLAHDGDPGALALGEEILSELTMPVLAVRGEGDGRAGRGGIGQRFFQDGRFFYTCKGVNVLGLDTVWQDEPQGPGFVLGEPQQRWLAEILSRLDPAAPLVIISHAPLASIYHPWGQWTWDSAPLLTRLSGFQNVLSVHGHVHHPIYSSASGKPVPGKTPPPLVGGGWGEGISPRSGQSLTHFTPSPALPHQGGGEENFARSGWQHIGLPATSWPLPSPLTGTPGKLRPGLAPRGCGWALLQPGGRQSQFRQVLWQA